MKNGTRSKEACDSAIEKSFDELKSKKDQGEFSCEGETDSYIYCK